MMLSDDERKAKQREYLRKWRLANRERIRENARKYLAANREKIRKRNQENYAANREERQRRSRESYAANREKKRAYYRKWLLDNPGKAAKYWRKIAADPELRRKYNESHRKKYAAGAGTPAREKRLARVRETTRLWRIANYDRELKKGRARDKLRNTSRRERTRNFYVSAPWKHSEWKHQCWPAWKTPILKEVMTEEARKEKNRARCRQWGASPSGKEWKRSYMSMPANRASHNVAYRKWYAANREAIRLRRNVEKERERGRKWFAGISQEYRNKRRDRMRRYRFLNPKERKQSEIRTDLLRYSAIEVCKSLGIPLSGDWEEKRQLAVEICRELGIYETLKQQTKEVTL